MKQAGLVGAIQAGKILFVGKFLLMKKDVVAYRDRESGQPATFNKVEYQVLGADGVVFVQPDTRKIPGFKMETHTCPFKQMQDVVVTIEKMEVSKGQTTIAGTIEALEA